MSLIEQLHALAATWGHGRESYSIRRARSEAICSALVLVRQSLGVPAPAPETRDRTGWARGPWDDEPDALDWTRGQIICAIRRSKTGVLCGYIAVPPSHPWHGKHPIGHDDVRDEVGFPWWEPTAEHPGGWWALGFDCGHLHDIVPSEPGDPEQFHYWTIDEVRAVVDLMADAARVTVEAPTTGGEEG